MIRLEMPSPADADRVAGELLKEFPEKRIWLFKGEMGAGKTTLIKAFCRKLGITDLTSSPTFSLVNEYKSGSGNQIFHFDFYRLEKETEALDIGIEEYFSSGNYCFLEWPEKISSLLQGGEVIVEIDVRGAIRKIFAKIS